MFLTNTVFDEVVPFLGPESVCDVVSLSNTARGYKEWVENLDVWHTVYLNAFFDVFPNCGVSRAHREKRWATPSEVVVFLGAVQRWLGDRQVDRVVYVAEDDVPPLVLEPWIVVMYFGEAKFNYVGTSEMWGW